jgi:hypothetical protein
MELDGSEEYSRAVTSLSAAPQLRKHLLRQFNQMEGQEIGYVPCKAIPHKKRTNLLGLVPAIFLIMERLRTQRDRTYRDYLLDR